VEALLHAFSSQENKDCLLSAGNDDNVAMHTNYTINNASGLDLGAFLNDFHTNSPAGMVPASPPSLANEQNMMLDQFLDYSEVESTLKKLGNGFPMENCDDMLMGGAFDDHDWTDNFAELYPMLSA